MSEPFFSVIGLVLREGKVYEIFVTVLNGGESDRMLLHVTEVIPGICVFARSQTL
jgi:hypothetical protein